MGMSKRLVTATAIGLFALAVPASAQRRGGGGGPAVGGGMHVGTAMPRSGGPRVGGASFGAPRQVFAPRPTFFPRIGPARIAPSLVAARFNGARMTTVPRTVVIGGRPAFATRGVVTTRGAVLTSRGFVTARGLVVVPRRVVVVHRFVPRNVGPRIVVVPHRFVRPFFAFRPRFNLGYGLWVGFPVAYPMYYSYAFPSPYPFETTYLYPDPSSTYGDQSPSYGSATPYPSQAAPSYPAATYPPPGSPAQAYPANESIKLQRGQESGGVSFEITPNTAMVYVDGTNVGTVAEFSPTSMPLTLTPGRHHIELRAAGYQTMAFDTEIVVRQVIPYRGEMQPQR